MFAMQGWPGVLGSFFLFFDDTRWSRGYCINGYQVPLLSVHRCTQWYLEVGRL